MPNDRGFPRGYRPEDPLVVFRRIPGTRRYYNPRTFEEHSTFFVQRYRKSRSAEDRERYVQAGRRYGRQQARGRSHLRRMFLMKWEHDHGHKPQTASEKSSANAEFANLYSSLIRQRYEYNHTPISTADARLDMARPGGPLSVTLEELGMRKPEDTWPVGMSPEGYSEEVMVPFFRGY